MNPIHLFTSFRGRTGRLGFWIGLLVLIFASPFSVRAILSSNPFTEAIGAVRTLGLPGLAWSLALLAGLAAIITKRLHDRGKSGLHAALFYVPAALSASTFFAGNVPYLKDAAYWSTWIAWWAGAAGLWFLFQLGFFAGERGPNKYGAAATA